MSCYQVETLSNESEIGQLKKELFEARCDANYYKKLHALDVEKRKRRQYEHDAEIQKIKKKYQTKIDEFQKTIARLSAKLKLRERQLFGKKSERHVSNKGLNKKKSKRSRGQQRGRKSPDKRKYTHLPIISELYRNKLEILFDKRKCPRFMPLEAAPVHRQRRCRGVLKIGIFSNVK